MKTLLPIKPSVHRWTREEFFRLADQGHFAGRRVELIDGEVIDMPAQKNPHLIAIEKTQRVLNKAYGRKFWVRAQATLSLGPYSVPDPDVAVVPGPRRADVDYPTEAVLVVEVSDTTLWYDRNRKTATYASAGVREYWIVNLVQRQLEVHRKPVLERSRGGRRPRGRYEDVTVLGEEAVVSPLSLPRKKIVVAALLP